MIKIKSIVTIASIMFFSSHFVKAYGGSGQTGETKFDSKGSLSVSKRLFYVDFVYALGGDSKIGFPLTLPSGQAKTGAFLNSVGTQIGVNLPLKFSLNCSYVYIWASDKDEDFRTGVSWSSSFSSGMLRPTVRWHFLEWPFSNNDGSMSFFVGGGINWYNAATAHLSFSNPVDLVVTIDAYNTVTYSPGTWEMETVYKKSIGPCIEIGWDASKVVGCSFILSYSYMTSSYDKYTTDLSLVLGSDPSGDLNKVEYSFFQAALSFGFCFPKK